MNSITKHILLLLPLLLLGGCGENQLKPLPHIEGQGAISLGVGFDSRTFEERVRTKADANTIDYKIGIFDAQDRRIRLFSSAAEVPSRVWLLAGEYRVEVEAGEDPVAGFDKPYYTGSADIVVQADVTAQQEVVCTLANAKVTVRYSEKIQNNFADFQTSIKSMLSGSSAVQPLVFTTEEQAGFFRPAQLQWELTVAHTTGGTATERGTFTAVAGKHYILEFDIAQTGSADGGMTFLTNITVNEDEIDVDDQIAVPLKRLPEITGVGYDIASDYFIQYGQYPDVRVNLRGTPQIDSVGFGHDCEYLTTYGQGMPSRFDLLGDGAISSIAVDIVNNLGITWTLSEDRKDMEVSFTELIRNLPEGTYHFDFGVRDSSGKRASKRLTIMISDSDVITVTVTDALADIWPGRATFRGRWTSPANPGGLAFEYQKTTDGNTWTRITEGITIDNATTGDFSVLATGLTPGTTYNYRAVSNDLPGPAQTMTTDAAIVVGNLNFDGWYQNGDAWMPTSQADFAANSYWFDSGNSGTGPALGVNPTTPESTDVHTPGGRAVRMESTFASMMGIGSFAAGNIFMGRFSQTFVSISNPGAELYFGRPFTSRPTKLRGWYKYTPRPIDYVKTNPAGLNTGDMDQANIYVALCDWSQPFTANTQTGTFPDWSMANTSVIAFGELIITGATAGYVEFTIDIEYRNSAKKPRYMMMAASSSRLGDYFTGGTGSVLLIDDFELIYD